MTKRQPPPPPGSERRQHTRFDLMAQVELRHEGEVALLPVINMSAGGVLVDTSAESITVAMGDPVNVFLAPDESTAPFTLAGKIVRIDKRADGGIRGIAVMWTGADAAAKSGLERLLERLKA